MAVLAQGAGAELGAPVSYPSYDIPEPIDTGDFDLDGSTDVVPLHGGWNAAGVFRQRADGTVATEEPYSIPYSSHYAPHGLAVADVSGDGSPDIVLVDTNNGLVVLQNTTAPTNVPAAPNVTAAVAEASAIGLTWSPPRTVGSASSGYRVYRGTASGGETLLATLGTSTSYTDSTAVPGTTYYYVVRAVDSLGEGARSNERSAKVAIQDPKPPTTPSSLKLVVAGTNQFALDWSASTDSVGVIGYRVYRNNVVVATVSTTQYLASGLAAATSFTYKVVATDAAGNVSAASSNLTAKISGYSGQSLTVAAVAGKTVLAVATLTK